MKPEKIGTIEGAPATSVKRVQRNVLAAAERRLLNRLCVAMPPWITPDRLTAIGMAGSLMVFAGYVLSIWGAAWLVVSLVGYGVQWFGDSMDGSLARFRQIERPAYGYFLDHSCDGITVVLILAGLGLSPYVRLDVALLSLCGYLLLSVHAFLGAKVTNQLNLTYLAAGPTELRLMLIGLTVAMMALDPRVGTFGPASGFDIFVGSVAAILFALFLVHTARVARQLFLAGK
jgi:phosphatidylglycerophosphate synthase